MRMSLKALAIQVLLRLQFQPFLFLFRSYYRLVISASVWMLRRFPGVKSVYLTGSFAGGRVLYGISDIDLVIFMEGQETDAVRSRIDRGFSRLRIFFPVLGADRKSVFFLDGFDEKWADFPILQHLFDENFYRYRLLYGKDVISAMSLPALSDDAFRQSILWKMKYWMEKIVLILCSKRLTEIQKKYSLYKALDDVARIHLDGMQGCRDLPMQGRSLERMKASFDTGRCDLIGRLILERKELFLRRRTDLDELFGLFKTMISNGVRTEESLLPADLEGVEDEVGEAIRGILTQDFTLKRMRVPPVTVSITDCHFFGCPAYVMIPEKPLGIEDLRRLKMFHEETMGNTGMLFIQEDDSLLYAVNSEMMEHWMYSPGTEEHVFMGRTGLLDWNDSNPEYQRLLEGKLVRNLAQIRRTFEEDAVDLLDTSMHAKLIFTALQRLIVLHEMDRGKLFIPADSGEVIDYLAAHTPLERGLLETVHEEYRRCVHEGGTGLNGYFKKLSALVRGFCQAVESGESLECLSSVNDLPDRESLSISVVIITRNRSRMLKRCLEALVKMRKHPQDVIVVDNASTDSTRDVVESFRGARPVRYVYESTPGVSRARNAGCRAAGGDIVAFLDDDAVPTGTWLENIENAFLKSKSIGIVGGAIHHFQNERADWISTYYRLQEGDVEC